MTVDATIGDGDYEEGRSDSQFNENLLWKYRSLVNQEAPEREPYKYKYAARAIFEDYLKGVVPEENRPPESNLRYFVASMHVGTNCIECEENSKGLEHLDLAEKFLLQFESQLPSKDAPILDSCCYALLRCQLNKERAIRLVKLSKPESASTLLTEAVDCLRKHCVGTYGLRDCTAPTHTSYASIFGLPTDTDNDHHHHALYSDDGCLDLELTLTHCLYYLMQVALHLGNREESARYCGETLARQYAFNRYEPRDWALNACTLAAFFLGEFKLRAARFYLLCATSMSSPHRFEKAPELDDDAEFFPKLRADIARMWLQYCECLMDAREDEEACANVRKQYSEDTPTTDDIPKALKSLSEVVDDKELIVRETLPATSYEETTRLFKSAERVWTIATRYYTLYEHCPDNIELTRTRCTLLRLMAEHCEDLHEKCCLHKRRADAMAAIVAELNPQHYLTACKTLDFERAEALATLSNYKFEQLEVAHKSAIPKQIKHYQDKLTQTSMLAIAAYESFLRRCIVKPHTVHQSGAAAAQKIPTNDVALTVVPEQRLPSNEERPVMLAHLTIGRLWSRLQFAPPKELLEYCRRCERHYKFMIDYCVVFPDAKNMVKLELPACEELLGLMPAKLAYYQKMVDNA